MKSKDKEKNITVLGKETVFDGVMRFTDVLHIEGRFTGDIDATGFLYVAKGAVCEVGHINVASIVVEGTVRGAINAIGDVELKPHSTIVGDIVALRLKIADDVCFHGTIRMLNGVPASADDIFSMDVSAFRKSLKDSQERDTALVQEKSIVNEEVVAQEEELIQKTFEDKIETSEDSQW